MAKPSAKPRTPRAANSKINLEFAVIFANGLWGALSRTLAVRLKKAQKAKKPGLSRAIV
jgi:hypothetical protein